MFETHLTVIGTLITNVNRRRLPDGATRVNFRVASNERRFDRATENWVDGDSLYVSVTCWRQLAENVHRTFNLGDPIIVQGRLHSRSYEDREGQRQSVIELEGLAVGPDLNRAAAVVTRLRRDGTPLGLSRTPDDQPQPDPDEGGADRGCPDDSVSDLQGSPVSDDPWRIDARDLDDAAGRGDERTDAHGAAAEAAVGA